MKINVTTVFVDDQARGARVLHGRCSASRRRPTSRWRRLRWLTVVSPEQPDGVELVLEPHDHPAVGPFKARARRGRDPVHAPSPSTTSHAEHERLVALGVRFTQPPADIGPVTTAMFDDTCGNLIQIASPPAS